MIENHETFFKNMYVMSFDKCLTDQVSCILDDVWKGLSSQKNSNLYYHTQELYGLTDGQTSKLYRSNKILACLYLFSCLPSKLQAF